MGMKKEGSTIIQGMPLGRGNATSPYKVGPDDSVVEFTEAGDVVCTMINDSHTTTTVLAGARYSIAGGGIKEIQFGGTFSIG